MTIDFNTRRGIPIILATINGRGVKLLIDTGANSSFIDKNLKKKLKFSLYDNDTILRGAGGEVEMYNVMGAEVKVNNEKIDIKFKAIEFREIRKSIGVAGILGSDFLIKNKLNIDFSTNQIYSCLE